jgi:hypothetical protein
MRALHAIKYSVSRTVSCTYIEVYKFSSISLNKTGITCTGTIGGFWLPGSTDLGVLFSKITFTGLLNK